MGPVRWGGDGYLRPDQFVDHLTVIIKAEYLLCGSCKQPKRCQKFWTGPSPPSFRQNKKRHFFQKPSLTEQACLMCNGASLFIMRICHQLLCTCAHNCFAQARPMAFRMRALLPCACPIYMNHRHADAIALHMRKSLPCTCAPHWFPHAQAIIPPRPQFANIPRRVDLLL